MNEDEIWRIARSEFSVLVFMCFLDAACDGVNINMTRDLRIRSETYGVLCPLNVDCVSSIESFGLFDVVRESGFDAAK